MDDAMCAMPSVDERIEGLQRDVNALYRLLPDENLRRERERREDRWWGTYRAVVPVLVALGMPMDMVRTEATRFANETHGPLGKSDAHG
jgi:hypothetical protein